MRAAATGWYGRADGRAGGGKKGIEESEKGENCDKGRLSYEDLRYGELERGEAGDEKLRARPERTEVPIAYPANELAQAHHYMDEQ